MAAAQVTAVGTSRDFPRTTARHAPAAPVQLTISGLLLRDAEMRLTTTDHAPTVTVLIAQPGQPPVRAVELFAPGSAACHAAFSKARSLRAGARVEIRGEGLSIKRLTRDGEALQVLFVHQLRLLEPAFDAAMAAANDHSLDGDER